MTDPKVGDLVMWRVEQRWAWMRPDQPWWPARVARVGTGGRHDRVDIEVPALRCTWEFVHPSNLRPMAVAA